MVVIEGVVRGHISLRAARAKDTRPHYILQSRDSRVSPLGARVLVLPQNVVLPERGEHVTLVVRWGIMIEIVPVTRGFVVAGDVLIVVTWATG